ncbi:tetratricopeptide (TPR) repeat protein [Streptomyces griseochromogenes]|uniref:Tetratricopeptide (TPR) repeat protein n=1 Tax=Streptomyces griseochromogenes TaxID=68214 RepID=A0ABS4LVA0_9ACTN|nr:tetratricopeptide (TPR) repeat protein [Streptomyces griseochromogenes]
MTRIRREVLTLSAARLGPDNPLPALRPLDEAHRVDDRERDDMPRDMARQLGYEPLRGLLPVRVRDGYGRDREPAALDALVIENDRLRATVLPGLGGRIASLVHLPTGRELLYRNPVFQPANFALNGAWYSGGIEWNIGATGHTTLSCAPLHAARVPAPDGGEMLRLWEWERLRDLPFQVDLWLPEGSDFLHVGVRIRNPHERPVPTYWWSNTAVPEDRRILAPAEEAWLPHCPEGVGGTPIGYERRLRRVPVPSYDGIDRTHPLNSPYAADYFYEVPDGRRRWIAALDADGHGLVQTSTDVLRGRKLFVWGSGPGGRRWQQWLTEPGTGGYCEIQAGLARTQLEHVRLEPGSEVSWLEAYGPLDAPRDGAWTQVVQGAEERLAAVLPRARVEEAYAAWKPYADTEPGEILAAGSGWGALEVLRADWELPGTPFAESTLGEAQAPWLELLRTGCLPEPRRVRPPGQTLVAPHWRDMLETAPATPHTEYHLGVAQWHAGDRAQAVRSWERALQLAPSLWALLRCLAVADQETGHHERAAERYAEAFDDLCRERRDDGETWTAAVAALGGETLHALLRVRRTADARAVWERLRPAVRRRGRFRLLEAELLLAEGRRAEARAVFDEGFEVADLREGADAIGRLWARLADEPLPERYDFRMRPDTP